MAVELDTTGNGAIDIARGGTNATTAEQALTNLGGQAAHADLTTLSTGTYAQKRALIEATAKPVDSIAALRLVTADFDGDVRYIKGYTSVNDGGQGVFVWNSASEATENNGTVIAVTGIITGRWLRIYDILTPSMFGGQGDGSDESSNVQAAINACSNSALRIDKNYNLGTSYLIISSPITIVFDGVGTGLQQDNANRGLLAIDDTQDVQIYGNGATFTHVRTVTGSNTLYIRGSYNVKVDGVKFLNSPKDCVYLGASLTDPNNRINKNIEFTSCDFGYSRRQGISVLTVNDMRVSNSVFHDIDGDAPMAGIDLEGNYNTQILTNVKITNCHFRDIVNQAGVICATPDGVIIDGCTFENCLSAVTIDSVTAGTDQKVVSAVDAGTDTFTSVSHGMSVGDIVFFSSTGTYPTGITSKTIYRIKTATVDEFTLSTYYLSATTDITNATYTGILTCNLHRKDKNANVIVSNNVFKNISLNAVYGNVGYNVSVIGNKVDGCNTTLAALHMGYCDYSLIKDNIITGSTDGEGIYTSGIFTDIISNTVIQSPDEGIRIYGGYGNKIVLNTLLSCGEDSTQAADIRYCSRMFFEKNTINDILGLGVLLGFNLRSSDTTYCIFSGNVCLNSASNNTNSFYTSSPTNIYDSLNIVDDGTRYTTHMFSTTTALESLTSDINVYGKYVGRQIYNTTTKTTIYSSGPLASDIWVFGTGATAHTPI